MKNYLLLAVFFAASAAVASAQDFRAPIDRRPRDRVERAPAPITDRNVVGGIPRGMRGGNPIQLLNPRAPRRYFGPPHQTVTVDPYTGKVTGIILFGIHW